MEKYRTNQVSEEGDDVWYRGSDVNALVAAKDQQIKELVEAFGDYVRGDFLAINILAKYQRSQK